MIYSRNKAKQIWAAAELGHQAAINGIINSPKTINDKERQPTGIGLLHGLTAAIAMLMQAAQSGLTYDNRKVVVNEISEVLRDHMWRESARRDLPSELEHVQKLTRFPGRLKPLPDLDQFTKDFREWSAEPLNHISNMRRLALFDSESFDSVGVELIAREDDEASLTLNAFIDIPDNWAPASLVLLDYFINKFRASFAASNGDGVSRMQGHTWSGSRDGWSITLYALGLTEQTRQSWHSKGLPAHTFQVSLVTSFRVL